MHHQHGTKSLQPSTHLVRLSLNATLQLPSLNVATETKLLPLYKGAHILAVLPGRLS